MEGDAMFYFYDPLWMFRDAPFSGDVNQRITASGFAPSLTLNYAGNPAVEERVVKEVASYGRQIGWLTEIALALAKNESPPQDTLRRLENACARIETIKKDYRRTSLEEARVALDRLKRDDPTGYKELLRKRKS
jgi:hypothetical protein